MRVDFFVLIFTCLFTAPLVCRGTAPPRFRGRPVSRPAFSSTAAGEAAGPCFRGVAAGLLSGPFPGRARYPGLQPHRRKHRPRRTNRAPQDRRGGERKLLGHKLPRHGRKHAACASVCSATPNKQSAAGQARNGNAGSLDLCSFPVFLSSQRVLPSPGLAESRRVAEPRLATRRLG